MRKTNVTCMYQLTQESINSWRGRNNLKIIDQFSERSRKYHTIIQILFKHYITLGSNRDLGSFGEFPHIENLVLVLGVNCRIYKHYANYVSEFCLFADIFFLKFKDVPF